MPSKSSPLDVMPTPLMKSCDDKFLRINARLVNSSFTEGRFPLRYKTTRVRPTIVEETRRRPFITSKLSTDIQLAENLEGAREVVTGATKDAPTRWRKLLSTAISLSCGPFNQDSVGRAVKRSRKQPVMRSRSRSSWSSTSRRRSIPSAMTFFWSDSMLKWEFSQSP